MADPQFIDLAGVEDSSDSDMEDPAYRMYLSMPELHPPNDELGGGKRRRKAEETTSSDRVEEESQATQWNEIDGLFCPICLEAWTNDGDHHISCLPCGHIFGMSCIKKWIQSKTPGTPGKCPQCNTKCRLREVRRLFAPRVVAIDDESLKMIRSLEAKCVSLQNERAGWFKKEAQWCKKEFEWRKRTVELHHEIQQLTESRTSGTKTLSERRFIPGKNILDRISYGKTYGSNLCGQASPCNFVLEKELRLAGAHLFDVDVSSEVLLISRRHAGVSGQDVLTKMSLIPPYDTEDFVLPSCINSIRDLQICPSDSKLALFACRGKKLAVLSTESKSVIVSYDLPADAWTCSWDLNNTNYIYAGLQNGYLLVFDIHQTSGPVECLEGLTSNPIHTVHSLLINSAIPSGVRTVMSASSIGVCLWNFGSDDKGPILVPETENQGVCISLAYCPIRDHIVASYRPKVEFPNQPVFSQPSPTPPPEIGQGTVVGSHVLFKREDSSNRFQTLGSTHANVFDIGLPKSAIIDIENHRSVFASEDKLSSELVLYELPSLTCVERLNLQQSPVHDVKYAPSLRRGLLSCLNGDTLQLFSTKLS